MEAARYTEATTSIHGDTIRKATWIQTKMTNIVDITELSIINFLSDLWTLNDDCESNTKTHSQAAKSNHIKERFV
jgi:hypothetical protein